MSGFNYGYGRMKLEEEFSQMAEICHEEKFPKEKIEEIHKLLLEILNSERRYRKHTQSYGLFSNGEDAGEDNTPLLKKFLGTLSITPEEISHWGRMAWIDDLDTPEVIEWVKSLGEEDLQLLTLLVVDDKKQTEIAQLLGKHDSAISRRMKKLRKSLAKVLPENLRNKYIK